MAEAISVDVVDDDDGVRRTLTYLLASAGFAVRVYPSAEAFWQRPPAPGVGCVLTDVRLPGTSGIELVRRLRVEAPGEPVVVMSGAADVEMAVEAMKSGAADFLQKPLHSAQLISALRAAVAQGAPKPLRPQRGEQYRRMLQLLSPRQRDVLAGILEGKLNKTIAHELALSVRTVEGYRAEIMAKTHARSLSELIRMAVLAGF